MRRAAQAGWPLRGTAALPTASKLERTAFAPIPAGLSPVLLPLALDARCSVLLAAPSLSSLLFRCPRDRSALLLVIVADISQLLSTAASSPPYANQQ